MTRGPAPGRGPLRWAAALRPAALALACAPGGCAAPPPAPASPAPPARPPTTAELAQIHAELGALRAELGERTEEIRVALEAPLLPGELRARGAVAAAPGRAARMILVGPGGATALDLWLDGARHRLEIPARERVERGRRGEPLTGVPLELLRAWFLEPLAGELLHGAVDDGGVRAWLRTPDAIVAVDARRGGALTIRREPRARRAGPSDVEWLVSSRGAACAEVRYLRPRTGVRASIVCERRRRGAAPRALRDPDEGEEEP